MDELKFNKWNNRTTYTCLNGSALKNVPKALANGGAFLTMAEAMDRKTIVARLEDNELLNTWFGNGFWTMTPGFYCTDGSFKIGNVEDPKVMEYIKMITSDIKGELYNGRVVLPDDFKNSQISGTEFSKNDIVRYAGYGLDKIEARQNPFWRVFSNYNQARVDFFIEQVYKLSKGINGPSNLMSVHISSDKNDFKKNTMGLFWFGKLGAESNSAVYVDEVSLSSDYGRLIKREDFGAPITNSFLLEDLAGKAVDAGNGIVVLRKDMMSQMQYDYLTGKKGE